jgi:hypothetical protein
LTVEFTTTPCCATGKKCEQYCFFLCSKAAVSGTGTSSRLQQQQTASTRSINQNTSLAVVEPRRLPNLHPEAAAAPGFRSTAVLREQTGARSGPRDRRRSRGHTPTLSAPDRIGRRHQRPKRGSPIRCSAHLTTHRERDHPSHSHRPHTRPHPCSRCRLFSGSLARDRGGKTENGPSPPALPPAPYLG